MCCLSWMSIEAVQKQRWTGIGRGLPPMDSGTWRLLADSSPADLSMGSKISRDSLNCLLARSVGRVENGFFVSLPIHLLPLGFPLVVGIARQPR